MNHDLIIIGGGSAGYAAARTAAALGLHTAVVDGAEELSGLCILRGCMPSKTLLASSSRFQTIRRAEEFGLRASGLEVRGNEIIARKRRLIHEFASYRQQQLTSGKFELIRGTARFTGSHTIEVALRDGGDGGTRTMEARAFIIATGSVIGQPPLPSLRAVGCWNSDDVLDNEHIPDSVILLGGGAIAVELATYYAGLGRKTTIIQRGPRLLKGTDTDIADALAVGLRARGVDIFAGTRLLGASRTASGKRVEFEQADQTFAVEAGEIVNCLGRSPNVAGLDLDKTGLDTECGRPVMRTTQQTSLPHIFAAGDIAGPYEIVHIAIQQGEVAARNAARLLRHSSEPLEHTDYRLKLYAIFSDPEVAACGASERELREAGTEFHVATYPFNDHGKSMTMGETDGFVKLIAAKNGELLGGAVVGPHASELIHEIVVAMRFRATAAQFAAIPHYHPTLSEIWTYPAEELVETLHS
jgi:pyruvate/2-oxoglutarate dehydrogenase complex dihydrolipoamide dehydrogenase (E3) component